MAEATRTNRDGIANAGFIIGRDAVCVTDPGGSLADGRDLRTAIRRRTSRPIRHVVLNHDHPDHIFGASAFVEDRPDFIGHAALPAALAARAAFFEHRLAATIGAAPTGYFVTPTRLVRDVLTIDLGDRSLTITAHPPAHTRCDVSLVDGRSGILIAGDLLFVDRVPSLDGSLTGWIAVLQSLHASRAVPGHGPAITPFAPAKAKLLDYLTRLRDETRRAIAAGVPIESAMRSICVDRRRDWRLFDAYNPRNVAQAYKELEWE